jgi:rubrerythrin
MDTPINADYVLQMAERIERNGADFYRMAAAHVRKAETAQLLLQLAGMEAQHEQTFAQMRHRLAAQQGSLELDPESETSRYLKGLLAGKFFDVRTGPADYLRDGDSPQKVLLTAIGLEKETIVFYEGVKRVVRDEDKPVVETVLREEMGHLSQLLGVLRV